MTAVYGYMDSDVVKATKTASGNREINSKLQTYVVEVETTVWADGTYQAVVKCKEDGHEIERIRGKYGKAEQTAYLAQKQADEDAKQRLAPLTKDTVFLSAKQLLDAGISCREIGGHGWAVYWMEGGAELTLFSGSEGPQEMMDVSEVLDAIGGDQDCVLTPASLKRFATRADLLAVLQQAEFDAADEAKNQAVARGE